MSLKSIIATPVFLMLATAAGAADNPPSSQRYIDVPPSSAAGPATRQGGYAGSHVLYQDVMIPSGAGNAPSGPQNYGSVPPGGAANAAGQGRRHTGGANFLLGDGSVRFNDSAPKDGGCVAGCSNNLKPGDGQQQAGQTPHVGGMMVGMADGSVRNAGSTVGGNETMTINGGRTEAPKGGSLGSLQGLGSIGQLAAPQGAGDTAGREIRNRSFFIVDRTQATADDDGTQAQSQNNMKQLGLAAQGSPGAGTASNVKVFNGNTGTAVGGASRFQPDGTPLRAKVSPTGAAGGNAGQARAVGAPKSR